MLTIADLHAYYSLAHVLRGVSLEAVDGRVLGLLGRNGACKTTLVSSIMGIPPAQVRRGSVTYAGEELVGRPPHQVARLGIGFVPQGRRVYRSLTVLEHLKVAARKSSNGEAWTVERVFQLFPRLAERQQSRGGLLSG